MTPHTRPYPILSWSNFAFNMSFRISSSLRKMNRNHFSPSFSSLIVPALRIVTYEMMITQKGGTEIRSSRLGSVSPFSVML